MENSRLNLQTILAVIFIFIFVAATINTVFGQEKQNESKKEHTKIIQLKVTEDENGVVKSIDTTYVMDQDLNAETFYNMQWHQLGDSINVMVDIDGENFKFLNEDSLMKEITIKMDALDDGKMMMFLTKDLEEGMEEMEEQMHSFTYSFENEMIDGDSLVEIMVRQLGAENDSLIIERCKKMNIDAKAGTVFIYSDGESVNVDEGGDVKVYKLGNGNSGVMWTGDTIIEDGNSKIIIKTKKGDDDMEQTIKYISVTQDDKDIDVDKDVKVVKMNGAKAIWVGENEKVYVLDDANYEFTSPADEDLESLKSAGVKTKKQELKLENLKFSPNPNNGKFNLSFTLKEKKKVTINIYDINGKVVYTETLKDFQGEYNKEIDISEQESGTFFLQIVQGLYDIIKKIIIQ